MFTYQDKSRKKSSQVTFRHTHTQRRKADSHRARIFPFDGNIQPSDEEENVDKIKECIGARQYPYNLLESQMEKRVQIPLLIKTSARKKNPIIIGNKKNRPSSHHLLRTNRRLGVSNSKTLGERMGNKNTRLLLPSPSATVGISRSSVASQISK